MQHKLWVYSGVLSCKYPRAIENVFWKVAEEAGFKTAFYEHAGATIAKVHLISADAVHECSVTQLPSSTGPLTLAVVFPSDYNLKAEPEEALRVFNEVIALCRLEILAR